MPIDGQTAGFLDFLTAKLAIKVFLLLFLAFYSIFSFVLLRQVDLMSKKLPTSINPSLKFIGIINLGIGIAFIFVVLGIF